MTRQKLWKGQLLVNLTLGVHLINLMEMRCSTTAEKNIKRKRKDFYMLSITYLEDKMTSVSIDYQDVLCFKL